MATRCKKAVDELVENYEKKSNKEIIRKTNELFNIVSEFISNKQLILYGGFALNLMLPKNKKIYDDSNMNDFDCFSSNAKNDAKELANLLAKNNFKYIEVKPGIHPGTWKVFVEFISVCDITQMPKDQFDKIFKLAMHENSIIPRKTEFMVAPISFLKRELCLELCQPATSAYRWSKLLERYNKFVDSLPDKTKERVKNLYDNANSQLNPLLAEMVRHCKREDNIFVGNMGINLIADSSTSEFTIYSEDDPFIEVISLKPRDTIKHAKSVFKKGLKIIKENPFTMRLVWGGYSVLRVYDGSSGCYSFCDRDNFRVGTTFTILYFLYGNLMDKQMVYHDDILFKIQNMRKSMKKLKCSDSCFMTTNCYGQVHGLRQIRKDSWESKLSKYRPNTRKRVSSLFDTEIHS